MSSIQLSKRITLTGDNRHRLQVWVSETSDNIPKEVFVYQRIPSVPLDTELSDLFVHIASYTDIGNFPIDGPDASYPFYRKHFVDLVFDSKVYLGDTWDRMFSMVKHTVEDIVRLNGLAPVEVQEINL